MLDELRTETYAAYRDLQMLGIEDLNTRHLKCLLTEIRQNLISASTELREAIVDAQTLVNLESMRNRM